MVIRNLTIFLVAVFWLATVYWVYKDARRRIEDPWLVVMATLLGLAAPFVGPIIYLFFRPPGVHRGRPRARAGDPSDGGAAVEARSPLSRLPGRRRDELPRLPRLHDRG